VKESRPFCIHVALKSVVDESLRSAVRIAHFPRGLSSALPETSDPSFPSPFIAHSHSCKPSVAKLRTCNAWSRDSSHSLSDRGFAASLWRSGLTSIAGRQPQKLQRRRPRDRLPPRGFSAPLGLPTREPRPAGRSRSPGALDQRYGKSPRTADMAVNGTSAPAPLARRSGCPSHVSPPVPASPAAALRRTARDAISSAGPRDDGLVG
jgi:hypothetical protein